MSAGKNNIKKSTPLTNIIKIFIQYFWYQKNIIQKTYFSSIVRLQFFSFSGKFFFLCCRAQQKLINRPKQKNINFVIIFAFPLSLFQYKKKTQFFSSCLFCRSSTLFLLPAHGFLKTLSSCYIGFVHGSATVIMNFYSLKKLLSEEIFNALSAYSLCATWNNIKRHRLPFPWHCLSIFIANLIQRWRKNFSFLPVIFVALWNRQKNVCCN